jgi:hypothetical protein
MSVGSRSRWLSRGEPGLPQLLVLAGGAWRLLLVIGWRSIRRCESWRCSGWWSCRSSSRCCWRPCCGPVSRVLLRVRRSRPARRAGHAAARGCSARRNRVPGAAGVTAELPTLVDEFVRTVRGAALVAGPLRRRTDAARPAAERHHYLVAGPPRSARWGAADRSRGACRRRHDAGADAVRQLLLPL